jgi:hypothetical protein
MSQLSFFSADAREPALADVEGLLAGGAQVTRRAGVARISVVVTEQWRVSALAGALADVGLEPEVDVAPGSGAPAGAATVRTPWSRDLLPVAAAWARGAVKAPPPGWTLDGPRLRWWCLAAGSAAPGVYTLSLGASDEPAWQPVGAALAAAGVPGVLVGPRADGPAYRIVGQRRLARLRELVGDAPAGVPDDAWPPLRQPVHS